MESARDYEKRGLKVSMAGSIALSVSAVIMALLAKSQAIMLDGVYTIVTLIMAFISLKVIDLVKSPETSTRPFGYMAFEPFLNIIKSLIMLTLLVVFLVTNIQELTTGGRIIALDLTIIYIFICIVIYAVEIYFLMTCKKRTSSEILALEVKNWSVDGLLTLGIAVSLIIAVVLVRMGHDQILPYIDPVMVVVLVILSLPVPIKVLVVEFRRLLLVSPENRCEDEVKSRIRPVIEKYGLTDVRVWGLKSGRTQYLFIYTGLEADETRITLLDEIRAAIFAELTGFYEKFWADIIFTQIDPDRPFPLAEGADGPEAAHG